MISNKINNCLCGSSFLIRILLMSKEIISSTGSNYFILLLRTVVTFYDPDIHTLVSKMLTVFLRSLV